MVSSVRDYKATDLESRFVPLCIHKYDGILEGMKVRKWYPVDRNRLSKCVLAQFHLHALLGFLAVIMHVLFHHALMRWSEPFSTTTNIGLYPQLLMLVDYL